MSRNDQNYEKEVSGKLKRKKKKQRRSMKKKEKTSCSHVNIIYSNIQGFTKKRESLINIMEELQCDVCLLAETMTRNIKIKECRCFTSNKSIGQNVCIIVRNSLADRHIIKMYEPNELINMIGIRIELMNTGVRIYTAHLKQQSVYPREDIAAQFEEIRKQFQDANKNKEGMMMIFDANVHVGKEGIEKVDEKQDWGGRIMMKMVSDENLVLLNGKDLCNGVVTRIDPRNGKGTTIDLAVCNQIAANGVSDMVIDEESMYKPTNYGPKVTKKTDHNTIIVKMEIEKSPKVKPEAYINTRDVNGREMFRKLIDESKIDDYIKTPRMDVEYEFDVLNELWSDTMKTSFKSIIPKAKKRSGISTTVKELLNEERWIRANIMVNPERGRRIAEIKKKIRNEIAQNRAEDMLGKISTISQAQNPPKEVFKIRREKKRTSKIGFPLKDKVGNIQVSKDGIDRVVIDHFEKVFRQNPIPRGNMWQDYWNLIDEICELIEKQCTEEVSTDYTLPTLEEINKLIMGTNDRKAVLGSMTSEMVKLAGDDMIKLIHRMIVTCCEGDTIPDGMRNEKLVILYKNKGTLNDMDNYRGIFIRLLCLSILQKWLYQKCSPIVDNCGSEYAFGGRKGRAVNEVLLIVRLVQDFCRWSNEPLILKFLDITKFFDTMNYKKCLIEAFKSGIKGKNWKLYKSINEKKICKPYTPLGECPELLVKEVFLQGSCDAMIMAWNLMDAMNKTESDVYDPVMIIDGVSIPRTLFVDDVLELIRDNDDLRVSISADETIEKTNRTEYKPSKCKLMYSGCTPDGEIKMNDKVLEVVDEHEYLGTIVEEEGRKSDLLKRVVDCKGVANEIVEVCKTDGIGELRLHFVKILIDCCFKSKFKHGCEVWDVFTKKDLETINGLIPNMMKRIMELPRSTPTDAIVHDFGIVDLELDVEMERIILACKVKEMNKNRIARRLFEAMEDKNIPGFFSALKRSMIVIGVQKLDTLAEFADKRKELKKMIIDVQRERLLQQMMSASKTDSMLLNFSFDGFPKEYIKKLSFKEAQIVFKLRARMFPTKCNFAKRWSMSNLCSFCLDVETDEHLFGCPGYQDVHRNEWSHEIFMTLDCSMECLSEGAKILIEIHDRLLEVNEDKDIDV